MALRRLLGRGGLRHRFSSEINASARQVLRANFRPDILYKDLRTRHLPSVPEVDLYVAGFPCQPFSSAGHRQGFADSQGRGAIFQFLYQYLRAKRPRAFVFENVPHLVRTDNGRCFQIIMAALARLRTYNLYWEILNAEDFGHPQHRPRLFIVGISRRHDRGDFCFPAAQPRKHLEEFLLPRRGRPSWADSPVVKTASENLKRCLQRLEQSGVDPFRDCYVVDCDASAERCHVMSNRCPCLLHSRARGYWITNRGRYLEVEEMMKLQGFPASYRRPVSRRIFGELLGNSMCVGVLVPLFEQVLSSAGLMQQQRSSMYVVTLGCEEPRP